MFNSSKIAQTQKELVICCIGFQTDSKWFQQDSSKSLTYILSNTGAGTQYSSYGCLYKNSNTSWGAQVLNNSGNDIYLYLGLKNTVNLS